MRKDMRYEAAKAGFRPLMRGVFFNFRLKQFFVTRDI